MEGILKESGAESPTASKVETGEKIGEETRGPFCQFVFARFEFFLATTICPWVPGD